MCFLLIHQHPAKQSTEIQRMQPFRATFFKISQMDGSFIPFSIFSTFSDVIKQKQKRNKKKHINKTKKLGVLNTANPFKHRQIDCPRYCLSTIWNNWHISRKCPRLQVLVLQWMDCSVIVLHNRSIVIIAVTHSFFINWILTFLTFDNSTIGNNSSPLTTTTNNRNSPVLIQFSAITDVNLYHQ